MQGALRLGYKVVEYIEVWHYREGGGNMFEEFILNIVGCKIECSGFPCWCTTHELKQQYVDGLFEKKNPYVRMWKAYETTLQVDTLTK